MAQILPVLSGTQQNFECPPSPFRVSNSTAGAKVDQRSPLILILLSW